MGIVTIDNIPVYDALIEDNDCGMFRISLVDDPAVMSNFLAFDKEKKVQMYAIEDEEQRKVLGVVMRADFPIYRRDNQMGEYYIIYRADTIAQMAEKYLLEARQNDVNLDHDDDKVVDGVQMVQCFIKDSAKGVSPAGFEDIADGSLFAEFHVVNDDVWEEIKNGTYKGFSLEGVFALAPEEDKDDIQSIVDSLDGKFSKLLKSIKNMSKVTKFLKALESALVSVACGSTTTDKGVIVWDGDEALKEGDAVFVEDAEGNRTPAEDGDYRTEDGKTIKVADGVVTEITDADAEVGTEDVNAKRTERFSRIKAIMSESYGEKEKKIYNAISAFGMTDYGFIWECGDDYAIYCHYGESTNWEDKFTKFDVSWDEDGNAVVSNPVEVKQAFVPVDEPAPAAEPAEETPTAEEMSSLKETITELRKHIEELEKKPATTPAHEQFKKTAEIAKTGDRGLDNFARILKAGR